MQCDVFFEPGRRPPIALKNARVSPKLDKFFAERVWIFISINFWPPLRMSFARLPFGLPFCISLPVLITTAVTFFLITLLIRAGIKRAPIKEDKFKIFVGNIVCYTSLNISLVWVNISLVFHKILPFYANLWWK